MRSDVLIIEKNASLGGTLAACEVGPMMTFHAGDKQAIKSLTVCTPNGLMEVSAKVYIDATHNRRECIYAFRKRDDMGIVPYNK